ncbi:TauD/TfdA dioxygenase family protein [Rhizorhabdus dicambivorans]|uniref:TauD/TfdA family dioxygenase n=1 Tax=Rhizorhabdus dicambivorans TaxID=1850238 RepID=A0A2A4G0C9_9SPHN|nr:TauD/TfdA family dioxygenase [Rhizorhabdus dicambivorans]ATE67402.1 TauD/TfdA family dioxygenase [Rhizorhabdus dicambivorans]PCE43157.1 TauD/TfdA family dioxygenase [Rhizorhabdus dicambivorans]
MPQPFRVAPLRDDLPFGAEIAGLDPATLSDPAVRQALRDIWTDKGVLVFRGLEGEQVHLDLSRVFGTLVQHPTREARAEHPELMTVRYKPESGWLIAVDGEMRGTWLPWHSDLIYVDRINRGGILRPIVLPSQLGQTGFIDKIGAWRTLPDRLKQRIEGLSVIYKYDLDAAHQRFGRTADVHMARVSPDVASIQARLDDFPRVIHPMVYQQRETGRKVLNVSPWFAVGIQGMENAEGDALLAEVADHIVHSEEVYLHDWAMGDMVLWDNWRVLHSATGCPPDEERWMLRTTIEGDYGLGRTEADAAIDRSDYITV